MIFCTLIYINIHLQDHTHTSKPTPLPCYPKQTLLYLNSNWTILELFIPRLQIVGGQLEKLSLSSIAHPCKNQQQPNYSFNIFRFTEPSPTPFQQICKMCGFMQIYSMQYAVGRPTLGTGVHSWIEAWKRLSQSENNSESKTAAQQTEVGEGHTQSTATGQIVGSVLSLCLTGSRMCVGPPFPHLKYARV